MEDRRATTHAPRPNSCPALGGHGPRQARLRRHRRQRPPSPAAARCRSRHGYDALEHLPRALPLHLQQIDLALPVARVLLQLHHAVLELDVVHDAGVVAAGGHTKE